MHGIRRLETIPKPHCHWPEGWLCRRDSWILERRSPSRLGKGSKTHQPRCVENLTGVITSGTLKRQAERGIRADAFFRLRCHFNTKQNSLSTRFLARQRRVQDLRSQPRAPRNPRRAGRNPLPRLPGEVRCDLPGRSQGRATPPEGERQHSFTALRRVP